MSGYCFDSDILIDYLRGHAPARNFLVEASKKQHLWISIISVVEIYSGNETKNSAKAKLIDEFLANFDILWLGIGAAKHAGELRRDHQKPFADMIIAASTQDFGLTLVTRNIKHFKDIAGLEILKPY